MSSNVLFVHAMGSKIAKYSSSESSRNKSLNSSCNMPFCSLLETLYMFSGRRVGLIAARRSLSLSSAGSPRKATYLPDVIPSVSGSVDSISQISIVAIELNIKRKINIRPFGSRVNECP